jgi:hypothetical protein
MASRGTSLAADFEIRPVSKGITESGGGSPTRT